MKNYQKVCHALLYFGNKIALAEIIKKSYHNGYFTDAGGKVEIGEDLISAAIRETKEETGLNILPQQLQFIDCFFYKKRNIKSFLFVVKLNEFEFQNIKNTEPHKHGNWKLYTPKEALKLKLLPSIYSYLSSLP